MRIIDFRLRPPTGGFLQARHYRVPESRNANTRGLGLEPSGSAEVRSLEMLFEEMDAVGIWRGVIVGRNTSTLGGFPNTSVAEVARAHPDRFIPVASVDPVNRKDAMQQIEEARKLGMNMLNLEPGAASLPMHLDDRRLYPIYAYCEDEGMPVILMSGGAPGPDISYTAPVHIDRVLADFPDLTVVSSHGNWPWVQEIIHVAYRRQNLYLCPDMYLHEMPGMDDYINAANGFLADRFLFGTAYPVTPIRDYTSWFLKLPLKPDVMEKVLFHNAARVLGLTAP